MRFSKILIAALVCLGSTGGPAALAAPPFVEKAVLQGPAPSDGQVGFDVCLRLSNRKRLDALLEELQNPQSPIYRHFLSPKEFEAQFGADPASVEAVMNELNAFGLTTQKMSLQQIHVTGTVDAVQRALQTRLQVGRYSTGRKTMVAVGGISRPPVMAANQAMVVGMKGVIRHHQHSIRTTAPDNSFSSVGPYFTSDLKQAYQYPSSQALTGKGANIGILVPNGFNPPDMELYFGRVGLNTPHIDEVDIDGGAPFDPEDSFEAHLDLQQAGGMAPGANLTLFNLPDLSDSSILDGLRTIVESNKVDVVNMSFGGAEQFYTPAYNNGVDETGVLQIYDDLFKQGNAQGITFVASSGDSGALAAPAPACFDANAQPGCGSFLVAIEHPASDPHVTAVGGTNLVTTTSSTSPDSQYVSEAAFDDPFVQDDLFHTPASGGVWGSGGGKSIIFEKPSYQLLVHTGSNVRTIPDLSGHMGGCPVGAVLPCGPDRSSDVLVIGGQTFGAIGTSASSPDFVGLLALKIEQVGGRLGNENHDIYTLAALQQRGVVHGKIFNTDIPGFNGFFSTSNGYNLVLGNGTVNGIEFLRAPNIPPAGTPLTPSNP
jgi:subtilase family serine protease